MTQEEFDKQFITVNEICTRLGITSAAIFYAKTRGDLPEPIVVSKGARAGRGSLWNREEIEPILQRWALKLQPLRG